MFYVNLDKWINFHISFVMSKLVCDESKDKFAFMSKEQDENLNQRTPSKYGSLGCQEQCILVCLEWHSQADGFFLIWKDTAKHALGNHLEVEENSFWTIF